MLGEYGTSANDVKAEFIWMSPEVGASGSFGGDDGLSGYMPLAVAANDNGAPLLAWVHANHMGVPAVYTNASGAAIAPPAGYSAPGFPGQSRTPGDLYYNRYRDYDPSTGRYIQADPIGLAGGASPYSYAMNNPLRYTDPTGQYAAVLGLCFTPLSAVACVIGGGVLLYATYQVADFCVQAIQRAFGSGGLASPPLMLEKSPDDGIYGGGIGSNYPGDETDDPCKQEWDNSRKICLGKGEYGHKLQKCMMGYVSRRCGGNRPDYEHDPRKPKNIRPKNWRPDSDE